MLNAICAKRALCSGRGNFRIVQNQSNSRVPGFGKRVRSVPEQAIGPDRSTSLSDCPVAPEKWTGNGAES